MVLLPVKMYESVNVPRPLYIRVKEIVEEKAHLGYRSITEFVGEALRLRMEVIEVERNLKPFFELLKKRSRTKLGI